MSEQYPVGFYPGDCQEKKLTRAVVYLAAMQRDGLSNFRRGHHLTLGGSGGDIKLLLAAGVPAKNIHVAEYEPSVCRALLCRYQVDIQCEDVLVLLAERWKYEFSTVNLDLCNKLNKQTVNLVTRVMCKESTEHATFAVTLVCDRELDKGVRRNLNRARREACDGFRDSPAYARCSVLQMYLRKALPSLCSGAFIRYTSSGKTVNGNPRGRAMCTALFCFPSLGKPDLEHSTVLLSEGISVELDTTWLTIELHDVGLKKKAITQILEE